MGRPGPAAAEGAGEQVRIGALLGLRGPGTAPPPRPPQPSSVNPRVPPPTRRAQNRGPEAHGLEGSGQAGLSRSLCLLEMPGRLLGSLSRAGAGGQGCSSGWGGRVEPRLPSDALETLLHPARSRPTATPPGNQLPPCKWRALGYQQDVCPKPLSHSVFMCSLSRMPVYMWCSS